MTLTRRSLLTAAAQIGGAGAVDEALALWDFLKPPPAMAAGLTLPSDAGRRKTVAILGAGVAGLCAAYELDRAGYDVVILEASRRIGGRSLTLRRGDVLKEMHTPAQVCQFDEGLWLNVGPGRIPHHHVHCHRLLPAVRRRAAALYLHQPRQPRAHRPCRQRPHLADAAGGARSAGPRRRAARQMREHRRHRPAADQDRHREIPGPADATSAASPRSVQGGTTQLFLQEPVRPRRLRALARRRQQADGAAQPDRARRDPADPSCGTTSSSATPRSSGRPRCWSRSAAWTISSRRSRASRWRGRRHHRGLVRFGAR